MFSYYEMSRWSEVRCLLELRAGAINLAEGSVSLVYFKSKWREVSFC